MRNLWPGRFHIMLRGIWQVNSRVQTQARSPQFMEWHQLLWKANRKTHPGNCQQQVIGLKVEEGVIGSNAQNGFRGGDQSRDLPGSSTVKPGEAGRAGPVFLNHS